MENNNFTYLSNENLEQLDKEDNKYLEVAKNITRDIKNKKLSILDIVQRLAYLLTNTSFAKRDVGVSILCESIKHLDSKSLYPDQLTVLSSYFSEKLKDHHQVATSALNGVYVLINSSQLSDESVVQLLTTIFNHVPCQQQLQQDRYLIYQIYETVLNVHSNVVDSMGIDFVYGIISSIDGERDPKNLIYLFNWLQLFLKKVQLGHLTEEMFDVLACYFPVDFKAPSNDKNQITREDLAQSLCKCLSCIPDFGNHAIPLALEKLDSALRIAKDDSLDLLKKGCINYLPETYSTYSLEIWNQLQKDVFDTSDQELKQTCLETVREIVKKLGSLEDKNKFRTTISDIAMSLKQNLSPDSKMFEKTSELLYYVAQANSSSSSIILRIAGGFLGTSYQIHTDASQKARQLKVYIKLIKAAINNVIDFNLTEIEEISNAPALCLQAILQENDNLCAEGYQAFIVLAPFLQIDIKKVLFAKLQQCILSLQDDALKHVSFACLMKMAEHYPEEIDNQVLVKSQIENSSVLNVYIEAICPLVQIPYFEDYVTNTLSIYAGLNVNSSKIILGHLNYFVNICDKLGPALLQKGFIAKLTDFLERLSDNVDLDYLHALRHALINLIRNQEVQVQQDIYRLESKKNYENRTVFSAVLSGLISGSKTSFDDTDKIDFLINCGENSADDELQAISVETLANILNKLQEDTVIDQTLTKINDVCNNCQKGRKINLLSWVIKGLVTRNHSKTWIWTDKLINILDEDVEAAKGFRIVMNDAVHNSLSIENNCNIMPLYKQKFFVYVTNKITLNQCDKISYYHTIGYLIENAPKQAVIGQFKKILKLVFLCLERCKEPEVLEIMLFKITDLVRCKVEVIDNNLEDILFRILDLTAFEDSMKVRIASIQCLKEFTKTYQIYKLVPFQQRVIQKLGACIDDKKRMVRREATECRSLWFLLDAPL